MDNATGQYSMAAFVAVLLWGVLGRRALILAGLCAGWAIAGRYTNFILFPAVFVFALCLARTSREGNNCGEENQIQKRGTSSLISDTFAAAIATTASAAPMLIKNWLLIGCPLAPVIGCKETFWSGVFWVPRDNLSVADLFLYPFVWTFGTREDMYGNISPLFLGFSGVLLAYGRSAITHAGLIAGLAGVTSLATWLLFEPFVLHTRYLFIPICLFSVPLTASVVAAEGDLRLPRTVHILLRSALIILLLFLLFQSRAVVYAIRYLVSIDTRAARYENEMKFGYSDALWLNSNVLRGQRVALSDSTIYPYFIDPNILWNSEVPAELQWLWERRGVLSSSEFWDFHVKSGYDYVVIAKHRGGDRVSVWPRVNNVLSALPKDPRLKIAFDGSNNVIVKIEKGQSPLKDRGIVGSTSPKSSVLGKLDMAIYNEHRNVGQMASD